MTPEVCGLLLLVLLCLSWLVRIRYHHRQTHIQDAMTRREVQRWLKPRTPDDCSVCRQQPCPPAAIAPPRPAVRPWCEVKHRRGAPKRVTTHGFACPNRTCVYDRITDAHVHVLVGDGTHGKHEPIQTFRCQACGTTFSARRHTPLYRLKTPSQRVGKVLTALSKGLDIAAAERVFGHRHATMTTWLTRAGEHSATLYDRWFQELHLPHVQLDELRTRLRPRAHILWLWVAVDPLTKLIPVLHLGARTQASAHAFIHDLHQRLPPLASPSSRAMA